jgi:Ni,Fe-hydrogenase III component G
MSDEGTIGTEARIAPEALPDACRVILDSYQARLLTMLGTDERAVRGVFRLHIILSLGAGDLLELGCELAPEAPSYSSITPILPAAAWYEREIHDLLGLVPDGHPDLRPLVLHGAWPAGYRPLWKDAAPLPAPDATPNAPVRGQAGLEDARQPPSADRGRPDTHWVSDLPPAAAATRSQAQTKPALTLGPLPRCV